MDENKNTVPSFYYLSDEEYEEYTTLLQQKNVVKTQEFINNLREKHNLTNERLAYNGCVACTHKCH